MDVSFSPDCGANITPINFVVAIEPSVLNNTTYRIEALSLIHI